MDSRFKVKPVNINHGLKEHETKNISHSFQSSEHTELHEIQIINLSLGKIQKQL